MHRAIPALFTALLAINLVSCGSDTSEPESPTVDPAQLMREIDEAFPSDGAKADNEMREADLAAPIKLHCYSHNPCDATYTPEKWVMSDTCHGRVDSYGMGPELKDGQTYLQTNGVFEVESANNGWTMMHDPYLITKDGFTETVAMAVNCHPSGSDQLWSSTVDSGQKARLFGVWIVPESAEYIVLGGVKMRAPDTDAGSEIDDRESLRPPQPEAASTSITLPSPSAPVGDSYTGYENGYSSGSPADEDPYGSQIPPRADGCVGPAAVCGYYDEQGNPIWFDKQTGETSPGYYDADGNPTMDPQ